MTTFIERKLKVVVQLTPKSSFGFGGTSGEDAVRVKKFRLPTEATVNVAGLPAMDEATIKIYGMAPEDMEALSFFNFLDRFVVTPSQVAVFAENGDGEADTLVYAGDIRVATPDYNSAPNASITIFGMTGQFMASAVSSPYSAPGNLPLSEMIKSILGEYNELSGQDWNVVDVAKRDLPELRDVYLQGSTLAKVNAINDLLEDSRIRVVLQNGTIYLTTRQMANREESSNIYRLRSVFGNNGNLLNMVDGAVVQVDNATYDSPIIGYPEFEDWGIAVKSLYLPNVLVNDRVQVDSIVPRVALEGGNYYRVLTFRHSLSSRMTTPGDWFTTLHLTHPQKGAQR